MSGGGGGGGGGGGPSSLETAASGFGTNSLKVCT